MVWERYNKIGGKRLKDNMHKIAKRKSEPKFMQGGAYEEVMKKRETPEFMAKAAQAALNVRGGKKDARVEPTHYLGSQSFLDRALATANANQGNIPTAPELFLDTHSKEGARGGRIFARKKDTELWKLFQERKRKNPDVSDNELWFDLVERFTNGGVYGTGAAQELFYDQEVRTPTSQKTKYVPSIVSQLQTNLNAEREARNKEKEERVAWETAKEEELKKIKEQLAQVTSYFPNCNTPFRPQPKDPRDPSTGGGSGAAAAFPTQA